MTQTQTTPSAVLIGLDETIATTNAQCTELASAVEKLEAQLARARPLAGAALREYEDAGLLFHRCRTAAARLHAQPTGERGLAEADAAEEGARVAWQEAGTRLQAATVAVTTASLQLDRARDQRGYLEGQVEQMQARRERLDLAATSAAKRPSPASWLASLSERLNG